MFESFVDTVPKVTVLMIVAALSEWLATAFDETLVKRSVGAFTVLFIESGLLVSTCLVLAILVPGLRIQLIEGVPRMRHEDWKRFAIITAMVVALTMGMNTALKHVSTGTIRIVELVTSLVIGGLLYFATTKDSVSAAKIIAFTLMATAAVIFHIL